MTKAEWLEFLETKGESLKGVRCSVPASKSIDFRIQYNDCTWTSATIEKLTKSTMVGVIRDGEADVLALPYDLIKLIKE